MLASPGPSKQFFYILPVGQTAVEYAPFAHVPRPHATVERQAGPIREQRADQTHSQDELPPVGPRSPGIESSPRSLVLSRPVKKVF